MKHGIVFELCYQNKDTAIAVAESLSKNRPEKAWVDYVRLEK